jgi:hypothetical protein
MMKRARRQAWLNALWGAAFGLGFGFGCSDGGASSQILTGRIDTTHTSGVVAIRAVTGDAVISATEISSDGRFRIALPAGSKYRLEVLTTTGVKPMLHVDGGWKSMEVKVCVPTAPFDMGNVGKASEMCDPSTDPNCDPGMPPPTGCTDPMDPNCPPPDPMCTNPMDPDCKPPPPPPCMDPMDPSCQPPSCGGMNEPPCPPDPCTNPMDPDCKPPPPPPCMDPMDPNCADPGGGTMCEDPMDPETCKDPCVIDPMSCGCDAGEMNCWPPPGPTPCTGDPMDPPNPMDPKDPTTPPTPPNPMDPGTGGMGGGGGGPTCDPDDGMSPSNVPGSFGCKGE